MKRRITIIDGMPVEIPELDETGETERARLNAVALLEYETHGTLVGEDLQKMNAEFISAVKGHVLGDEEKSV
ncbi:MAG TPA: hypothetical protein VN366_12210 [Feifaniaceae bacterium]|nr:hypothetical protein [Feifaniaceae bacterium]